MADVTGRYGLPLLQAGQSQKEITHNEALVRTDALLHPSVESRTLTAPPTSPTPGQAWIVGDAASGEWAGQDQAIAAFHAGGWSFIAPSEGCLAWVRSEGVFALFGSGGWETGGWPVNGLSIGGETILTSRRPPIVSPSGGATVDAEARTAIDLVLGALRAHGLIEV